MLRMARRTFLVCDLAFCVDLGGDWVVRIGFASQKRRRSDIAVGEKLIGLDVDVINGGAEMFCRSDRSRLLVRVDKVTTLAEMHL